MKFTRRGEFVIALLAFILFTGLLVGATALGQHWKEERLQQQSTSR